MEALQQRLSVKARLLVAVAIAVCYWSSFQPSKWVLGHGLDALGHPAYRGVGMLLPHLLLYSTLTAACCALAWWLLARARMLPPAQFALTPKVVAWGLAGGAVTVAFSLVVLPLTHFGALHWVGFNGWSIAGNLFSNFFEEFIFRGFMLVALTALVGFWPAAALSSLAFGFTHTQYPLILQFYVAAIGFFWAWIARKARSLWAPYMAHMIADVVIDMLIS